MYVIFDPQRPHIALGTAETLDAIATALTGKPGAGLMVCVNRDGLTHSLSADERRELDEQLKRARNVL